MAADLVSEHGSTLVFCRTKRGADRVAVQLKRAGVSAIPIHGGRSQSQRDRALASFAGGQVQALVATDVAARGIHVDNVACVVHFDVAGGHKDYVHRSGRTGRAGAGGVVVSFVTNDDVGKVRQMQRELDMPLLPGSDRINGNGGSRNGNGGSRNGNGTRNGNRNRRPTAPQHRGQGQNRRRNRAR
jgi:superfamily II DNA/RNA helicase